MSTNYDDIGQALLNDRAFMAAMTKGFADAMIKAQAEAAKQVAQKASLPNDPSYNLIHGIGSMFGAVQVGIDPDVISAMMHWRGVGELLPREPVRTVEQFLPFITGVEPTSSTEATTACGDCISGETEACIQHFPTGKICRETKAMTMAKAIERLNRGDIDLNLLNDQLGSDSPWHPGGSFTSSGEIINVVTAWALLFELPPLFMHALSPMVYTGNPANNNGDYKEFRGLQLLVNTGFVDAFANVTCPALDSDVKNFSYGNVKTSTNPSFMEMLEMAHYYVRNNARGQRLDPVTWACVMRPELWQIVSSILPYQSIAATLMNATFASTEYEVVMDGQSLVNERNAIRQGMTINLNGENVRVVVDDGIPEANNANNANCAAGEYASDVYLLPIRYMGGRPAMRIDYKDYRYMNGEIAATDDLVGGFYKPSPDGRFSWSLVRDGRCFKIQAEIEPRIILKTPQLAARIQNVKYVPLQHLRSPDPDSSYFHKGGISTRSPSSYYH